MTEKPMDLGKVHSSNRLDQLITAGWETDKGRDGEEYFRKPANIAKDPHYVGPVYQYARLTLDEAYQKEFGEKTDANPNS